MITLHQARSLHASGVPFVFFDTETTGFTPGSIVEIAAEKVVRGKVVGAYEALVMPDTRMEAGAEKVHGITMAKLEKEGRVPKEVLNEFYNFVGTDAVLVAHNLAFDLSFLNAHNQREGIKPPRWQECCTLALSRDAKVNTANKKLVTLVKHFGISFDEANLHRAMADVSVMREVFLKIVEWGNAENDAEMDLFAPAEKQTVKKDEIPDRARDDRVVQNEGDVPQHRSFEDKCASCSKCSLRERATQVVVGEGGFGKGVLFVGEAPGASEDKKGVPFCGASGKFLDEMLASVGWTRDDVYITNIVKCRPTDNRDPTDEEKEVCGDWLKMQIETMKPRLIVTLGRHSMGYFLPGLKIGEAHGKLFRRRDGQVFLPLYHPAVALYNGGKREELKKDFALVKRFLEKI